MKQLNLITVFLLLCFFQTSGQSKDTTILIIPCKTGSLIIDGLEKGNVEADDAHPEKLSFGDHYLQKKTPEKKYSQAIRIDQKLTSILIRLGCEEIATPTTIKLLDKKITIVVLISPQNEKNTIGLDAGDELLVTCSI